VYLWNRVLSYEELGQLKEAMEDFIHAEYIKHDDKYISSLFSILGKQPALIDAATVFYNKLVGIKAAPPELEALLAKYKIKVELSKQANRYT
jgi:hypothetical protein